MFISRFAGTFASFKCGLGCPRVIWPFCSLKKIVTQRVFLPLVPEVRSENADCASLKVADYLTQLNFSDQDGPFTAVCGHFTLSNMASPWPISNLKKCLIHQSRTTQWRYCYCGTWSLGCESKCLQVPFWGQASQSGEQKQTYTQRTSAAMFSFSMHPAECQHRCVGYVAVH